MRTPAAPFESVLSPNTAGTLNGLLYPVIFERKPWEAVSHALSWLDDGTDRVALRVAIDEALRESGWLHEVASVGPTHTEEDLKKFLVAIKAALFSENQLLSNKGDSGSADR